MNQQNRLKRPLFGDVAVSLVMAAAGLREFMGDSLSTKCLVFSVSYIQGGILNLLRCGLLMLETVSDRVLCLEVFFRKRGRVGLLTPQTGPMPCGSVNFLAGAALWDWLLSSALT